MTAREKFEARLKELGLESEYAMDGHVGKVMDDGSIVVLVHIENEPGDGYTEFRYEPYEELWKDPQFREKIKNEFYDSTDDHFVAELAYWLDIHKNGAKCPLFPVDLYWAGIDCEYFDYEDDKEIELCGRRWEPYDGEFEPDHEVDWLAGKFTEGELWINNCDGVMVLVRPDGKVFMSTI